MFTFTQSNETITVILDGEAFNIRKGAQNFFLVAEALTKKDVEAVRKLISIGMAITDWSMGAFVYKDGLLIREDAEVPSALQKRIVAMLHNKEDPKGLVNFWERLKNNTSKRSIDMLYDFLKHENVPIDDDGFILAYKKVNIDYTDKHSGQFINTPGSTFFMARSKISDDPRTACAEGFHVGSLTYVKAFGVGRIVICRVDPADVVCVPYDCEQSKIRVSRYTVVGHYTPGFDLSSTRQDSTDVPEWDDEDEDDEGEDMLDEEETLLDEEETLLDEEETLLEVPDQVEDTKNPKPSAEETLSDVRARAKFMGLKNVHAIGGGKKGLLNAMKAFSEEKPVVATTRPSRAKPPVEVKPSEYQAKKAKLHKVKSKEELAAMNVRELQYYAVHKCKLVGVSKAPRKVLLKAIEEIR